MALLLLGVWVACVFVSIVLHELGHALAGRQVGVEPYVVLYQMGGLTYLPGRTLSRGAAHLRQSGGSGGGFFDTDVRAGPRWYWLATTGAGDWVDSGPMTNLVVHEAIEDLVFTNGVWTVFNLLPILPLDGGQVLRDVLGPRLLLVTRSIGGGVCGGVRRSVVHHVPPAVPAVFPGLLGLRQFPGRHAFAARRHQRIVRGG